MTIVLRTSSTVRMQRMCVSQDTPDLRERNGQAQRLSLKRWYETVTISKQLDSDRRAAYVPQFGSYRVTPGDCLSCSF